MSSYIRLVVTSPLTVPGLTSVLDFAPGNLPALQNFENYIGALAGGNQSATLRFKVGAIQATATITSTGTATAAQTMTLGNVTLTAVASAPAANQFVVSATPATQATNLAACINASASFTGKFTAVAVLGVVTVTAIVPGLIGNALQIVNVNLGNVTVAAFANGTDGTATTMTLG